MTKNYVYNKKGVKFKIASSGVSKTNILKCIAKIPKKYFKGIDTLHFQKLNDEKMYNFVSQYHHEWEERFNRNYHGIIFEDNDGNIHIGIFISDDFYRELSQDQLSVDLIRRAIIHELGHHLAIKHGYGGTFSEKENEDFIDRFVERHTSFRFLMFVSPKKIREYDRIWNEIEDKEK